MNANHTEKLFSYGTLRYENVQLTNFGRKLEGTQDALPGFALSMIEIKAPEVVLTSGERFHPIITYTGNPSDQVEGMVFHIGSDELEQADKYEVAEYKRISVQLASGIQAWVYINAEQPENQG
ncbi:gamma-glutamylcyclotransferase family protein [Legionella fallonii]|uniref:Gamma-glutamylcyclotransferase AIG2-like domain-containing protein n=1 Tax=Legionella fallonii LLAP-10 TaxID=1212491 RepID=A0A098G8Y6_9GAMM|nr:gamma-glutamylcyclotransferase family protein [Legionella fallonii]CEG57930.1 conserved protein of unknown function [Legionella fallonii LLAP-10]